VPELVDRIRRGIDRHGGTGAVKHAAGLAREALVAHEEHIVYELLLAGERPHVRLPEGLELVRATEAQLPLLERIPATGPQVARRWLAAGNALWFVLEGDTPAFSCWTFPRALPAAAAPHGELVLPDRTTGLENSVTSPAYRGRGVAPAAWSELADRLQTEGVERMITQVTVSNIPSRKAVEKAGYREFARVERRRVGPWSRVRVDGVSPAAAELRAQLQPPP
jgi:ribosomal protein S18 acetylase RimI-like enzyme